MATNCPEASALDRFFAYAARNGMYPSAQRLEYLCRWYFRGVPLEGRDVLDVGCGTGLLATYARLAGARRCLGIEPESDGAIAGSLHGFREMIRALRLDGVDALSDTMEQVGDRKERFDIVSLHHVVNHLDESAVINLHRSSDARRRFTHILASIHAMLSDGGTLILTDVGRMNLFAPLVRLGLRHPFEPTIEWHKHQEPARWTAILRDVGFNCIRINWRVPNRLRAVEWLLANRIAARCLTSEFRIVARMCPTNSATSQGTGSVCRLP